MRCNRVIPCESLQLMSARLSVTLARDLGVVLMDDVLIWFQLDPFPLLLVKVGDVASVAPGLPPTAFPLPAPTRVLCAEAL